MVVCGHNCLLEYFKETLMAQHESLAVNAARLAFP
jgi:hypothetical protein